MQGAGFGLFPIELRGNSCYGHQECCLRLPLNRALWVVLCHSGMEEPLSTPLLCFDFPVAFPRCLCCLTVQKVVKLLIQTGSLLPWCLFSIFPLSKLVLLGGGVSRKCLRSHPSFQSTSALTAGVRLHPHYRTWLC